MVQLVGRKFALRFEGKIKTVAKLSLYTVRRKNEDPNINLKLKNVQYNILKMLKKAAECFTNRSVFV